MISGMYNVRTTISHDEIRKWVKKHKGRPVILDAPDAKADKLGLRIDFPGIKDEKYLAPDKLGKSTSWDDFFKVFEDQKLAFIYQDDGYEKDPALMYEFIKRDNLREKI